MTANDKTTAIPYERFFALCGKAAERYGSILHLPVAAQPYAYLQASYAAQYPGGWVLDFGGGARKPLQQVLGINDAHYHACDTDPSGEFTYAALEDIPRDAHYDIVAANQVFEHLTFEDGVRTAMTLARHVAPGGVLLIGVPNPAHPTRHMSNPTHQTPWNYLNLYALLALGGLDPFFIARCNKVPAPRWHERPLINLLCRVFRMDWCDTVYAVGKREDGHGH